MSKKLLEKQRTPQGSFFVTRLRLKLLAKSIKKKLQEQKEDGGDIPGCLTLVR